MPIELSGMDDLLRKLDKTRNNVRMVRARALQAGAEVIRKAASEKAPRGSDAEVMAKKYSKGKHLADNIAVSSMKSDSDGNYVDVGPERGDNDDFFYGKFFEFGRENMSARPFIEPAIKEKRDEALDKMAEVIREAIENV